MLEPKSGCSRRPLQQSSLAAAGKEPPERIVVLPTSSGSSGVAREHQPLHYDHVAGKVTDIDVATVRSCLETFSG
jgi:hypothetical protein